MNSYSSRSNARRAALKAGVNEPDISVYHLTTIDKAVEFGFGEKEVGRYVYVDAGEERRRRDVENTIKMLDKEKRQTPPVSKWDRDEVDVNAIIEQHEDDLDKDEFTEAVPTNTLKANLAQSTIENPVQFVHQLADSMPGARRKDVVNAAVEAGVAFHTARTQYQVWFRKQRRGVK